MQYRTLSGVTGTRIYTDDTSYFRLQIRTGTLYIDKALTATGFDGIEDVDWEWINNFKATLGAGVFRYGVRDGHFVIDETLTATGFTGAEDTDWENIYKTKKP